MYSGFPCPIFNYKGFSFTSKILSFMGYSETSYIGLNI